MRLYQLQLRVTSPFVHAWQADTIFGGLCWSLRDLEGEETLAALLREQRSESPPVVISNGFPGDLLPRPILPLMVSEEHSDDFKLYRKIRWLRLQEFIDLRMGLPFEQAVTSDLEAPWREKAWTAQVEYHNAISRDTDTVLLENGLYPEEEFTPLEDFGDRISIYAYLHDDWKDRILRALEVLGRAGLGGEKSKGKGGFTVEKVAPFEGFPQPPSPGGVVVLSDFVAHNTDPQMGYWSVKTKYAKLGGVYSSSGSPFKRPFLALEAGSCFVTPTPRHFYGRMVEGLVPSRPEVLQYGLGLALAVEGNCFKVR